tara:strand:- start:12791 stop:13543 length:753 start_codon:yes stop_codon:yes gene_type:complete
MNKLWIIALIMFIYACGSNKYVITSSLEYRSSKSIVKKVNQNHLDYNWFTAKLSGKIEFDGADTPISANLRIRKDSVIWLSVSALLGIEVARIQITPDSLKMMNRINKTYWSGDFEDVESAYGIPTNYEQLEGILVGQISLEKQKLRSIISENKYLLFNKSKKEIPQTKAWIDNRFLMHTFLLEDELEQSLTIRYVEYEKHAQRWVPLKLNLLLANTEQQTEANFTYSKVNINNPKKVNFSVPENYVPID